MLLQKSLPGQPFEYIGDGLHLAMQSSGNIVSTNAAEFFRQCNNALFLGESPASRIVATMPLKP